MIKNLRKDLIILFSLFVSIFLIAYMKDVFSSPWWINLDMDIIISSNSISLLNNKSQSYFDHPGLTTMLFFSGFLKIQEIFKILNFELENFYDSILFLKNLDLVIFQLRIFNLLSISILLFSFFKIFEYFLKNKFFSFLLTLSLLINYNFLSLNLFPARTEVLSLLFLNLIFIISVSYNLNKFNNFLLGIFFALALFAKIQIILIFFIYFIIFINKHIFFDLKKRIKIYFKYFFFLNTFFSTFVYFYTSQYIDSFILFILLSCFNIYLIDKLNSKNFLNIYFFYIGFFLIIFIFFINYDLRNIEVVLNPIKNSLRWSQDDHLLKIFFNLNYYSDLSIIDVIKNYKNFFLIIFLNLFFLITFSNNRIIKLNYILTITSIFIVWILFSQRSGFLRYGIYILPCLYLLFVKIFYFDKKKLNKKILFIFFIINIFFNLSFFTKKYETADNYININRIQKICSLTDETEKFYQLNYFFSNKKKDVEIICSNIGKVL